MAAESTAAAAAAVPQPASQSLSDFFQDLFFPSNLATFRASLPEGRVRVLLHSSKGDEGREVTLEGIFPFHTLLDVKLALYLALGRDQAAVPEFVYLAQTGSEPGKSFGGGRVKPVDFSWNLPTVSAKSPFFQKPPFDTAAGEDTLDGRFVDSTGERRPVSIIERDRMTLEDVYMKRKGPQQVAPLPVFHAYLFKDVVAAVPGPKPMSERDWNGRIYPYFPNVAIGTSEPTRGQVARTERLATIFERRQQFAEKLEELLGAGVPLAPLTLAGVRYLQLSWPVPREIPGIEAIFYEMAVNARRPFLRLIPTENTGISKVFLKDGKAPDIQDPKLLVNWSQERSPTPERDFVFAKLLVRQKQLNLAPLYATVRLLDDGSADMILEPPRGVRKLDPRTDLLEMPTVLEEGLKGTPIAGSLPDIKKAMLVFGIRKPKDSTPFTIRSIRARIPIFSAFFQEISPLPGETPLIMLRYKLVSNFANEDRIGMFMTQVKNRKLLRGEALLSYLTELVADEFQLDADQARKRVAEQLRGEGEVVAVDAESKTFAAQYNPGIDIGIFAQHPFYSFHVYRADSLENLQRVVTLLSLLMSADVEDLEVGPRAVKELTKAEEREAATVAADRREEGAAVAVAEDESDDESGRSGVQSNSESAGAAAAAPNNTNLFGEPENEGGPPVATEEGEDAAGADELPDYLDDMMFAGDEQTLEEAHAAEEAAAAVTKEGGPFPEAPRTGEEAAPAPAPFAEPAGFATNLRRSLAAEREKPAQELAGLAVARPVGNAKPAAAPGAAAARPAPEPEEDEEAGAGGTAEGGIANFFIRKLQEADSRLFTYEKTHPSAKRYVSQCQPTYGRQPAVLSEEKFEEMVEEYKPDGVVFQVFPLMPDEPERIDDAGEVYPVLRYGTTAGAQNYYVCSKYFCTRDEIVVREKDLEGTTMRRPKGAAKRAGECPFCRGRVVKNRKAPAPGETILERVLNPPLKTKRFLHIGFLGKTHHPEGYSMPCCFLDPITIRFKDAAFDKYRQLGIPPKPGQFVMAGKKGPAEESDEEDEATAAGTAGPRTEAGLPLMDYYVTMASVPKKYIIGAEKLPLEVGTVTAGSRGEPQIGLLPAALDPYFDQEPTQLVSRSFNPQKLKPDGAGFLRIGVENRMRHQNDSLLAAIAPYFLLNTAEQLKKYIKDRITPRIFLGLNYGNLALEFYDPTDPRPKREELAEWASQELEVDLMEENFEAIMRAYMSYTAWERWLMSTETKKEYRHFALMFAQSRLMRKGMGFGITFIVLDIAKDGKMSVRCPPYGYNAELMARNDVGFLMHHWSGIWEPIFHADNRAPVERGIDVSTLLFQNTMAAKWPPIVGRRLQEFTAQCGSSGRAAYTSQSQINPMAMIPASVAKRMLLKDTSIVLEGIVRDAYNHLAALLYKAKDAPAETGLIALPVADDGELIVNKKLVMDWDDPTFVRAPIDTVLEFYKKHVEELFAAYPGYSPIRLVKMRNSGELVATQLRNGLYVPVAAAMSEELAARLGGVPSIEIDQLEWSINHEIALKEEVADVPGEKARMEAQEFVEIFEHLRLTFANWLAGKEDAAEYRATLEGVIHSRRLPLWEKRKRLEILLEPEVARWLTTDFTEEEKAARAKTPASLLRVDCRLRTEEKACEGRCVWRRGGEAEEKGGSCLLHVPKETELGEVKVSAPRVLLLRLIEELLRYGERRRQLLHQDVSRIGTLERPIRVGNQYILPEKSQAWFELLRLDWAKKPDEEPRFFEEMRRDKAAAVAPTAAETAAEPPLPANMPDSTLPPSLATILNGGSKDPKTGALRLLRRPYQALLTLLGLTPAQVGIADGTAALEDNMIKQVMELSARPVLQIDLRQDPPKPVGRKPPRPLYPGIPVFVALEDGPALLVRDPAAPALLSRDDMPKGLLALLDDNRVTKGLLKFKAPPPPPQAPEAP